MPVLLLAFLAAKLPGSHSGGGLHAIWSEFQFGLIHVMRAPGAKLKALFIGIRSYGYWLDGLTLAVLGLPVLVSMVMRRLSVHAGMLVVSIGLLACYVVFPEYLAATDAVDVRFALMVPLVLAVALRPELPYRPALAVAASLFIVSLTRTSVIAGIWRDRQEDVSAMFRALAAVEPGAAVLPLEHQVLKAAGGPIGRYSAMHVPSFRHLPTLALPWRRAFVPTLFAFRGKQPIEVLSPWDEISEPNGGFLASVQALVDPAVYAAALPGAPYLKGWRERFDFALVVNADMRDDNGSFVPPIGMELVADEGFAQLYRIKR